jgi:large subunit ribosomal protein L13
VLPGRKTLAWIDAWKRLPHRLHSAAFLWRPGGISPVARFSENSGKATMTTTFVKTAEVRADWYVVDAEGKTLGRLATQLAHRLKGKHKADYSPHVDMGDNLIVLNAEKIRVTGAKLTDKFYHQHTGYMGNLKSISLGKMLQEHPERAIQFAVKGMLPKNTLGRKMFRKLHVFAGNAHPHQAQQPKSLDI